jgi:hypothetical protein
MFGYYVNEYLTKSEDEPEEEEQESEDKKE